MALLLGVAPQEAARCSSMSASPACSAGPACFPRASDRPQAARSVDGLWHQRSSLALAAYFHSDSAGSVPLFLVFLIVGAVFFDGGFSNIGPYPAEIFPVQLSGRAVRLAQLANGVGKIVGPLLCLALIVAGADNLVHPSATAGGGDAGVLLFSPVRAWRSGSPSRSSASNRADDRWRCSARIARRRTEAAGCENGNLKAEGQSMDNAHDDDRGRRRRSTLRSSTG